MRIGAEFTHEILPPNGVPLSREHYAIRAYEGPEPSHSFDELEPGHFLDSFVVTVEGEKVRITPIPNEEAYSVPRSVGDDAWRHFRALHALKAEVQLEAEWPGPKKLDTEPFERRAVEALRRVLRRLREVTGVIDIDVHVGSFEAKYFDEDEQELPRGAPHSITLEGVGSLDWLASDHGPRRKRQGHRPRLRAHNGGDTVRSIEKLQYVSRQCRSGL